jgi:hypothetical protein
VVGASTEIKRAILLPGAKAPHLNYVGDSILGAEVNLGAGTILSNFRHDGGEITIPAAGERLATGRRKLGALLGDGVATGCNCVLNPGCDRRRGTQIYPLVSLRPGLYGAGTVIKLRQDPRHRARAETSAERARDQRTRAAGVPRRPRRRRAGVDRRPSRCSSSRPRSNSS